MFCKALDSIPNTCDERFFLTSMYRLKPVVFSLALIITMSKIILPHLPIIRNNHNAYLATLPKMTRLLTNVHETAEVSKKTGKTYLVSGKYEYYHYVCDGFDDRGWGCGYRTLQTLCSWLTNNQNCDVNVPSIAEIQEILVRLEDKPKTFLGSRQWIGSFEVCLVIDKLYDIPCKILHVNHGDELQTILDVLVNHFEKFGSPVMMGGNVDASSKGIMGIHVASEGASLLVVDPHYVGKEENRDFLFHKGWVKWQRLSDFLSSSFYNLCLPQVKAKGKLN